MHAHREMSARRPSRPALVLRNGWQKSLFGNGSIRARKETSTRIGGPNCQMGLASLAQEIIAAISMTACPR